MIELVEITPTRGSSPVIELVEITHSPDPEVRLGIPNIRLLESAPVAAKMPKKKCCTSKPKCKRCPLRMLAEGRLPDGYTVRKRKLVKVKAAELVVARKGKKSGKKKSKKGRLPEAA